MSEYDNVPGGALRLKGALAKEIIEEETSKPIRVVTKTEAEKKFEEIQRKRLDEKVEKAARKSHKERVAELNRKLEEMTEHYDIPKVGPG
ncbi:6131_t:CDS:2 [Dentiscutata heterogama]|uniref:6131_t:CDS:1 n=1 Tax=Dentiscutata heterogama TaxID=1316150 RepID=A0ACA9K8H1_9GLOM|nr:6131_t:CDS:2 [Dentiscutata heterogama]